jgi:hypothetical protein
MNATDRIVSRLLSEEPYKTELLEYTLLTTDNIKLLKKGMHIKYITLDEELRTAGTFLGLVNEHKWSQCCLKIMAGRVWKLKFQKHFIFFKEKKFDFGDFMRKLANGEIQISIKKSG